MMVPWRARLPRLQDWPTAPKGLPAAPNHDGDSVTLLIDRYTDDMSLWRVRLLALFCPELNQPGGPECRVHATEWLMRWGGDSLSWPFWVDSVRNPANTDEVKTFDRYVCLVSNADRTSVLNHEMALFVTAGGWGGGIGAPVDSA
jgi:hypothetical protein